MKHAEETTTLQLLGLVAELKKCIKTLKATDAEKTGIYNTLHDILGQLVTLNY